MSLFLSSFLYKLHNYTLSLCSGFAQVAPEERKLSKGRL